jgi:transcriptional regulator with XRE-family HTH domain
MTISSTVGANVLRLRKFRKMSQVQLAELSGLTRSSISNLETGHQNVRIDTLALIARALGVAPDSLLGLSSGEMFSQGYQEGYQEGFREGMVAAQGSGNGR